MSVTYTGRTYDPESGLCYYRYRYYHPRLASFLSRDPIGYNAGDINRYDYVSSSPVNALDPFEHGHVAFRAVGF